jgi:transforming growth factor-beta-induced protein
MVVEAAAQPRASSCRFFDYSKKRDLIMRILRCFIVATILANLALSSIASAAGRHWKFLGRQTVAMQPTGAVRTTTCAQHQPAKPDIVDTAVSAGSFKTLVAAVKAAGLVETLQGPGPFTVFAPTDEAFAALPKGTVESLLKPENKEKLVAILTYHVVSGRVLAADVVKLPSAETVQGQRVSIKVGDSGVFVDGAKVVKTDIEASNGIIHVIDSVLIPGEKKKTGSKPTAAADIVATAIEAGSFKTLVAAVKAAGLVETLQGPGPFTVFAPTDEAFAALPKGTVESLLKPENKQKLVAILTYHVVPGRVLAADVVKLPSAETVQGQRVSIKVGDSGVFVDGAKVVKTDIVTSNGIIHVIDAVILPR